MVYIKLVHLPSLNTFYRTASRSRICFNYFDIMFADNLSDATSIVSEQAALNLFKKGLSRWVPQARDLEFDVFLVNKNPPSNGITGMRLVETCKLIYRQGKLVNISIDISTKQNNPVDVKKRWKDIMG